MVKLNKNGIQRKTPKNERGVYSYKGLDGREVIVRPNEDDVTEVDIELLHKFDDREIDNEYKNKRKRLNAKEKEEKKKWEDEHPGEIFDSKYAVSIEKLESGGIALDKSSLLAHLADRSFEHFEKYFDLYQAIEQLEPLQQELIQKIFFDGFSQKEMATERGVSTVAIHQALNRIFEKLKKFLEES